MGEEENQKLDLRQLLTDEAFADVPSWWSRLSSINRARGRWCFLEPEGLPMPRQRARYELKPVVDVTDMEDDSLERHNKTSIFKVLSGEHNEAWKNFCLKSTNQIFCAVPEPRLHNEAKIWLRVMAKSHNKLLRPGALDIIEAWQPGSTARQRSALSELFWSLNGHMTSKLGRSETKLQYGPKTGEKAHINLIDPFFSSNFRPSSAPIVHASQLKLEKKKREEAERQARLAAEVRAKRAASAGPSRRTKGDIDTLVSTIPMKWPVLKTQLASTTQEMLRSVTPADRALCTRLAVQPMSARPPASAGMGRILGKPEWHGDAMYGELWVPAKKSYQELETIIANTPYLQQKGKKYVL